MGNVPISARQTLTVAQEESAQKTTLSEMSVLIVVDLTLTADR